jgi:hypothetical protein
MLPKDAHLDIFLSTKHFGSDVTLPGGQHAPGIFDIKYTSDTQQGGEIAALGPQITMKSSAIVSLAAMEELTIDSRAYIINSFEPGTDGTTLINLLPASEATKIAFLILSKGYREPKYDAVKAAPYQTGTGVGIITSYVESAITSPDFQDTDFIVYTAATPITINDLLVVSNTLYRVLKKTTIASGRFKLGVNLV